jgi:GT2 family glycosyltransferase
VSTFAVVVNYGTFELTRRCAGSLLQAHPPLAGLVLVENGTNEGERLAAAFPSAKVVISPRNLGFSGGTNLGLKRALAEGATRVLLLNSDACMPGDGPSQLERALDEDSSLGIVAPLVVSPSGQVESAGIELRPSGRMLNRGFGRRVTELGPNPRLDADGVVGTCMLIRREVLEAIGNFDEEYFYGFEDLDFCLRARDAGFRSACIGSVRVEHLGSASIGAQSPRRLYFAVRNHLRLLSRRPGEPLSSARAARVIGWHLAHALFRAPAPRLPALAAIARGILDHRRRRYGADDRGLG